MLKNALIITILSLGIVACSSSPENRSERQEQQNYPAEQSEPKITTRTCGNDSCSRITFTGRGLLLASATLSSGRATSCKNFLEKLKAKPGVTQEEIAFITSELNAWESQSELTKFTQLECKDK